LGVLEGDIRLEDLLGEELHAQAAAAAEATEIPLDLLKRSTGFGSIEIAMGRSRCRHRARIDRIL
jgi:hypothetical protein